MNLKFTMCLLCAIFIGATSYSQDVPDWVWKTPMTKVHPTGEFNNLPVSQDQVNYQNPNTTTRIINQNGQYMVLPPNIRPFPHTATQSEVDAANMKGNSQIIYAQWNSFGPSFFGTGFCFSNNGGTSWTGSHQTITGVNSGDPGPWIWPAGSTWPGRLGISYIAGAGFSTNDGATWGGHVAYTGGSSFDKNLSAVDDVTGSPFLGRAYTVWTWFSNNRISISFTTNGGATWSPSSFVSPVPAAGHHQQGCDIEVGPGGVVYVVWAHCTTNGQNSTEDHLGFARSTDGGVTWATSTNNVVDINGIRAANLFNGIRAAGFPRIAVDNTGGSRNGWIYVTLAEKTIAPATDVADITFCRSTDAGATWNHTRVNQDTPGNGRFQYMSDIDVASDGSVCCSYYDQRNTTGFVTEYWMSRSLDGGNSWTDVAVSDHTFTPAPIPGLAGGYQGDYTGITNAAGKVWPFWADNSSGIYQVWTVGITIGPPPANDVIVGPFLSLPSQFVQGTNHTIKARVQNGGTNGQTSLPVRFSVNGTIQSTNTIPSLPAGAVDSSAFTWNPGSIGSFTLRIFSGAGTDENRLNDTVTTVVNVLPQGTGVGTSTLCRNNINKVLPDNSTIFDTINVNISNSFNVIDVNARVDTLLHTWTGDVAINLNHLAGSSALFTNRGGSGDNILNCVFNDSAATPIGSGTAPFTGTFRPESPLTAFNNNPVNGLWVLSLSDNATADTGLLKAWCLVLTYQSLIGGVQTTEIPNYYSLSQNYPNPFNPSTSIKYTIPKAGIVSLKVFDVLGKEVALLVNETKQPGVYNVDFNASNLASGIYFYRIDAGDFSSVKKMVLVK